MNITKPGLNSLKIGSKALWKVKYVYGIYRVKIKFLFSQNTHSDLNSDLIIQLWVRNAVR